MAVNAVFDEFMKIFAHMKEVNASESEVKFSKSNHSSLIYANRNQLITVFRVRIINEIKSHDFRVMPFTGNNHESNPCVKLKLLFKALLLIISNCQRKN